MQKPSDMFDRDFEWIQLGRFAADASPGATLGVVSGRRRQGKTFLLRALCQATGGFYFAADEAADGESLRRIGAALSAHLGTPAPLRFADWHGVIDALLALFSLAPHRHSSIGSYSKGMRQRILLIAALLHDPEILILDEPLSGLDVVSAMIVKSLIKTLGERGKAIFYCSHVLEVVEKVCSSVIILRKGKVVAHDAVERLRDLMNQGSLEGVFTQLTEQEDPGRVVCGILAAMRG